MPRQKEMLGEFCFQNSAVWSIVVLRKSLAEIAHCPSQQDVRLVSKFPSTNTVPNMFLQVFTKSLSEVKNGKHSSCLPRINRYVKV